MDLKTSPEDKFLFVQIIFFFLGLGTLLPWNFFITALPYFEGRLSLNVSTSQNSTGPDRDHWHFGNWMTLLSMLPLLLFTCLNSFLYPRVSEKLRIAGSLFAILFLFLVTVIMVKISIPTLYFFIITMSVIWFTNSFGAVLQGSLFGLIGLLPRRYSSVFMSGQGVAGMFAVMASIFAKISGADKEMMALGYFITPCLVILLTIVFYFLLPQLEFAKYHFSKSKQKHSEAESNAELLYQRIKEDEKNMTSPADVEFCITEVKRGSSVISVFRKIWMMAISVCLVFTVTLSVFPVITVRVGSHTSEGPWKEYFTLVACFLLFNVMDWIGRSVTAVCTWPRKSSQLTLMAVLRAVFIPLFVLCNVKGRVHLTTVFLHDGWYILFMVLFAFSNGYLVTVCTCYAPKLVSPKDAETAGAVMAFFLALGLALGAALSFAVKLMI
ncbi:equilibrative nucleoside transporter 2-like isoform X2 [Narcine bancroftii]|uniref:equilibrative nucleoside transporter 2-like isoform X2 n=1 Tax=Narcine bancroftii TaxID=1343680 RepID=UPI0038320AA1